jgi:serine/threonine protein kinase
MRSLKTKRLLQNRYVIEKELGRGGFGAVYQAQDMRLRKTVALKEIHHHHINDAALVRKFKEEAFLMARLSHPSLPNISDYFEENNSFYLVMEFVPGGSLDEYLAQQPERRVDEDTAGNIVMPVLDALEYLHTHNPPIIHRDIKPGNIRLTPNGRICLVDFGLAKAYDSNRPTTVIALTPGFAPYEQYAGDMRTDQRSDIYSLGATLYYMLSGGVVPQEAPSRLYSDTLPPLSKHNKSLSLPMQMVISKMLAVRPDNRYQNIAELRQALREVEGQKRVEQEQRKYRAQKRTQKRRKKQQEVEQHVEPVQPKKQSWDNTLTEIFKPVVFFFALLGFLYFLLAILTGVLIGGIIGAVIGAIIGAAIHQEIGAQIGAAIIGVTGAVIGGRSFFLAAMKFGSD